MFDKTKLLWGYDAYKARIDGVMGWGANSIEDLIEAMKDDPAPVTENCCYFYPAPVVPNKPLTVLLNSILLDGTVDSGPKSYDGMVSFVLRSGDVLVDVLAPMKVVDAYLRISDSLDKGDEVRVIGSIVSTLITITIKASYIEERTDETQES